MKILQRFFRISPAVVAASIVEIDQPKPLHFDPHRSDGIGPAADDGLVGVAVAVLGEGLDLGHGVAGEALHFRQQCGGLFVREKLFQPAQGYQRTVRGWPPICAKNPPALRQPQAGWRKRPMSVEERVKSIIVEQLGVDADEVTADASFVEDLGADSLDQVELIMAFEEEFGVEISDDEAEKIRKVKDAVDYIEKRAKAS